MRDDEHRLPHHHDRPMLRLGDIRWTVEPVERLEQADPLTMTSMELLAYTADLQSETRLLRAVMHESLAHVAKLTDDVRRQSRVIEHQRRQLRDERELAAA